MKISMICKENRIMLDLTINEFAKSINIDPFKYEQFENGINTFNEDEIKLIFKSLYINKDTLTNIMDVLDDSNDDEERKITLISLKVINACEEGN